MIAVQAFYKAALEPVSLWSKVTGQKNEKNAIIEINNLLSEKPIAEVSTSDIQAILSKYQLNLYRDFREGSLRELYKKYLRYCFDDNHLDEAEIQQLRHLKRLLGLSARDVEVVNHQVCLEVYERALDEVLEDHRLDDKEIDFLRQLQHRLQLPPAMVENLYQHKAQHIVMNFIKGAVANSQLSPEEEAELQTLIDNLNIHPEWAEQTQAELAKYRLFWQIENDALPPLFVPIRLQEKEECYFLGDALPYQATVAEKPRKQLNILLHHKLSEGTYWRSAPAGTFHPAETAWKQQEQGKLYLTNQRLLLRQSKQETAISLNSILDFDHYRNGILLQIAKRRPLFLAIETSADIFAMLLGKVLRER